MLTQTSHYRHNKYDSKIGNFGDDTQVIVVSDITTGRERLIRTRLIRSST